MRQALGFFGRAAEMGFELTSGMGKHPLSESSRHPLIQDLEALDPRQRRELACALSMLWDEFMSEAGGDEGHLSRTPSDQAAYVLSLRQAAHQVRVRGGPEKLHYALATELMALYAEMISRAKPPSRDREIAATIHEVAAHGGLVRRAGRGTQAQRRAWDA